MSPASIVLRSYQMHPSLLCEAMLAVASRHTDLAAITSSLEVANACKAIAGICLDAAGYINEGDEPALLMLLRRPEPAMLLTRAAARLQCLPAHLVVKALAMVA